MKIKNYQINCQINMFIVIVIVNFKSLLVLDIVFILLYNLYRYNVIFFLVIQEYFNVVVLFKRNKVLI